MNHAAQVFPVQVCWSNLAEFARQRGFRGKHGVQKHSKPEFIVEVPRPVCAKILEEMKPIAKALGQWAGP